MDAKMQRRGYEWLFVLFLVSLPQAAPLSIRGKAFDLETQKLQYSEDRKRILQGDQRAIDTVRYTNPQGQVIATKSILYRSALLPEFHLHQTKPLFEVKVRYQGAYAIIDMISEGDTTQERVELPQGCVADAGFDALITRHLALLQKGQTLEFPMLVPEFGRVFQMRLVKISESKGNLTVRLQPASRILSLFGDPIEATYQLSDGKLLQYKGVSDLKDLEEENFEVRIEYGP